MARPQDNPFHPNPMENNVNQQQQNGEGNAANGQQNDHQMLHSIWNHIVRMPPLLVSISQAVLGLQNVFADKIQQNSTNDTPLMMAIKRGNITLAMLLIGHDANVHIANCRGRRAVHYAAKHGMLLVLEALVRKGADVNARDSKGTTPLHLACLKGKLEVARLLIGEHADVNATNRMGATPLQYAVWNGHLEVMGFLLSRGANINAQCRLSNTDLGVDTFDEE